MSLSPGAMVHRDTANEGVTTMTHLPYTSVIIAIELGAKHRWSILFKSKVKATAGTVKRSLPFCSNIKIDFFHQETQE